MCHVCMFVPLCMVIVGLYQGHLKKRKLEGGQAVAGLVGAPPTANTDVKEEAEQPSELT